MNYRKLTAGVLTGAVALLAGLGSGTVQAAPRVNHSPSVLPVVQDSTTTMPIMGAALIIHIQTGPGGNVTLAEITAAGTWTAMADPNRVSFTNADGSVKVKIKSRGNSQSVSARAGSLLDISGDGSWSGEVFGTVPGPTPTTVNYTVGPDPATPGGPLVTITGSSDAAAFGALLPAVQSTDDEGGMSSRARIVFTSPDGSQSRTLTISATVRTFVPEADDDDDDDSAAVAAPPAPITVASLRVTLSGFKGLAQDLATAAGDKTWNGFLCNGDPISVAYTVNPDGSLTLGTVTPPPSKSKSEDGKIDLRWGKQERLRIQGRVNNGQITINIRDRFRCRGAEDPTVNGATVVSNGDDDHHGDGKGKGNGGGGDD